MSSIQIHDLPRSEELDRQAMVAVYGGAGNTPSGNAWLAGLGSAANVNVRVIQDINQLQDVEVNALNNVGAIGTGFALPRLDVSPSQWAGPPLL